MERIVVSVRHRDGGPSRDLEVPGEIRAGELAPLLFTAVAGPEHTTRDAAPRLEIAALGRLLEPHETLTDVGAWDGSDLVVHPAGPLASMAKSEPPGGLRLVQKKQGFAWKRLDD